MDTDLLGSEGAEPRAAVESAVGVVAVLSRHATFAMQMRRAGFTVVEGRDIDDLAKLAASVDVVVVDLVAVDGKRGLVARVSTTIDPRVPVLLISADEVDVALLGAGRRVHVVVPPVRAEYVVARVREILAAGAAHGTELRGAHAAEEVNGKVTSLRGRAKRRPPAQAGPTAPANQAHSAPRSAPASKARESSTTTLARDTATVIAPTAVSSPGPTVIDLTTLPPPLLSWRIVANQMAAAIKDIPVAPQLAQTLAQQLAAACGADVAVVIRDEAGCWRVEGGVGLRSFEWAQTLEDADWLVWAGRDQHPSLVVTDTDVVRAELVGAPLASRFTLVRTHAKKAAFFVCAAWTAPGDDQARVAAVVDAVKRNQGPLADAIELRTFARWLASRVDGVEGILG